MGNQQENEILQEGIPFFVQKIEGRNGIHGPTPEEIKYWSIRACGISCLKMILEGEFSRRGKLFEKTLWELIQEGRDSGAYSDRGWIHRGLLKLAKRYGLEGKCHRNLSIASIGELIKRGSVCIASVSLGFRGGCLNEKGALIKPGGHLIVLHGIKIQDEEVKSILCHHPSSRLELNWENFWVTAEKMERSFSGNLIEIHWEKKLLKSEGTSRTRLREKSILDPNQNAKIGGTCPRCENVPDK